MNDTNNHQNTYSYCPPLPKSEEDIMSGWTGDVTNLLASILCATFQHKDYIEQAINGFLMQKTNFPFEIIIRDDASTDGTREIVKKYKKNYPNIIKIILEEENQFSKGVKPLMAILPVAKGKYIALCEGDDFWVDDEKLQKQVSFLEKNDSYVIAYSDAVVIDSSDNIECASLLGDEAKDLTSNDLILSASVPTLTRCFRNVIKSMPKEYDYVKNGDTFLISVLGEFGGAKFLPDIKKSVYRRHCGGIWSGIDENNKRCMLGTTFYWMSIYYKRIGLHDIADTYAKNSILQFSNQLNINKKSAAKIFIYNFSPVVFSKVKSIFEFFSKAN